LVVQKRIKALAAVSAIVAFGLAAATSASASTLPVSVSAARHTVRSAAANAVVSPGQSGRLVEQELVGSGALCLTSDTWCLNFSLTQTTQATIADSEGNTLDEYLIRHVSGDNTFTFGSGYNALYSGDPVYCFEEDGIFVSTTLEANGDHIVNGYGGTCTGVYDEWVFDGYWLINVGVTDWYYTQGDSEYPYSSVMESGCDNDTTCSVWVEESATKSNDDDQWYFG
jgi:hypothetical protein